MADLDQLEQEVGGLSQLGSSIFSFTNAYNHIEEAARGTANDDADRLRDILDDFRAKIPDLLTYNRLRKDARDLADNMMLASLAERIARISARNEALSSLTGELKTQIAKANGDATLLTRIKDGVDKATKTVGEMKGLVDQLTATDATAKSRLKALIERLANVSSIFKPQDG